MIAGQNIISWSQYTDQLQNILLNISIRDHLGQELGMETGFTYWKSFSKKLRTNNGDLFFIGNGASASMASHFATDITKNGQIKSHVFTDMSLLTALGNDISFEETYATPLQWYAAPKDMLIAISSSGNSPNIIRAAHVARKIGATCITLSAMQSDNSLRQLGDLNFYIPAATYGHAESGHATILHYWMDLLEK